MARSSESQGAAILVARSGLDEIPSSAQDRGTARGANLEGELLASAVTYFVFRTGLGAVCLLAGLEKARAPQEFVEGVRQYRLVPLGSRPSSAAR